jgi:hypothetical protein
MTSEAQPADNDKVVSGIGGTGDVFARLREQLSGPPIIEWRPTDDGEMIVGTVLRVDVGERMSSDGTWYEVCSLIVDDGEAPDWKWRVRIAGSQSKEWWRANRAVVRPGSRIGVRYDGESRSKRDESITWSEFTFVPDVRESADYEPEPTKPPAAPEETWIPSEEPADPDQPPY